MESRVLAFVALAALSSQARILPKPLIVSQAQFYPLHDTPRGYLGRYVDQPLLIDNAAAGANPLNTRMTPAELTVSRRHALAAGLDGFAFFPKPELYALGAAAGTPEARHVPIICLWMHEKTEMESFGKAICNPQGVRIGDKTLVLSYWTDKHNTPEQVKAKLDAVRKRWGDRFVFVPDIQRVANYKLRNAVRENGRLDADMRERLKNTFRDYLRVADGIYAGETHMMARHENGVRAFDHAFYREIASLMRETVDEPEFAGRKLLGLSALAGHENAYMRGCNTSHDGTRTLRRSFSVAASVDPDFIMIPEWDEYNENTCIAPTLYNSFSAERILRCLADSHRGEKPHVRPGDDTSVPNLVVSYRKSLSPGEDLCVETVNVPDGTWSGKVRCKVDIVGEGGAVLAASEPMELSADSLSEARYTFPAARLAAAARAPRVRVYWRAGDGREGVFFDGLHPVDLAPANSWNPKWVKQPVRDIAKMSVGEVSLADGRIVARLECSDPIRFAMLCGNGRIQYIHGRKGETATRFRETAEYAVFEISPFYPKTLLSRDFRLSVSGVKNAEWAFGDKVTRGTEKFTSWISSWAEPLFLRIPVESLPGAKLVVDYQDRFKGEIPLAAAFVKGTYVVGGRKGIQFAVARFKGQCQYPAVWNGRRCDFSVSPDSDRESMMYHVQVTTMSGKTWRSAPVVAGRTLPPVLEYDFSDVAGNAILPRSGERFFCAVAGGPHTVASLWNRGPSTKGVVPAGSAYWDAVEDGCPRRERQDDGSVALVFDGVDDYVSLPHETIPAVSGFELSLEILPRRDNRKEMVFASRSIEGGGSLWGVWHEGGRLFAAYTSMDPDGIDKGWCEVSVRGALKYGVWNRIAVSLRAGELEVSANGAKTSKPCGGRAAYTTDCILGGWPGKGFNPFSGKIRNFAVRHLPVEDR